MEVDYRPSEAPFGNPFAVESDTSDDDDDDLQSHSIIPTFPILPKPSPLEAPTEIKILGRSEHSLPLAKPRDRPAEVIANPSCESINRSYQIRTSNGISCTLRGAKASQRQTFERLAANRSLTTAGRAERAYYGVPVHDLLDDYKHEAVIAKVKAASARAQAPEPIPVSLPTDQTLAATKRGSLLWTEKYRAKRFTDLVGDERTHRQVLRWIKAWDPIVFPSHRTHAAKKLKMSHDEEPEHQHRKILVLTGPPGLGKTTLAHVAARQVGYEVLEINASDDRSSGVVKGRIRDALGTQSIKGVTGQASKPACVVVDEVDGAMGGSSNSSGEGGFIHALIELVNLDLKNSAQSGERSTSDVGTSRKRKSRAADTFRLLRPLVLICNDLYHSSLKPLRQSSLAEIVYVKKPPLPMIIRRMQSIFEREGIPCDPDGARRLCESSLGISNKKEDRHSLEGGGEGDLRSVLVAGQWAASLIRKTCAATGSAPRLTREWVDRHIVGHGPNSSGGQQHGKSKSGTRELVQRIFSENAGFPKSTTTTTTTTSQTMQPNAVPVLRHSSSSMIRDGVTLDPRASTFTLLRALIDSSGEQERVATDVFLAYPDARFQDDDLLSKPLAALEWLHFVDQLGRSMQASQAYELLAYHSAPILGLHQLFASPSGAGSLYTSATGSEALPGTEGSPEPDATIIALFSGPRADFHHAERLRASTATLQQLHAGLSIPLQRAFRSPTALATDLAPYLQQLLAPAIAPVLVGDGSVAAVVRRQSEREMLSRAVGAMVACGVGFEKMRVELVEEAAGAASRLGTGLGGLVYRVEPPVDEIATFGSLKREKGERGAGAARFAVRQVLEGERRRETGRVGRERGMRRAGLEGDVPVLKAARSKLPGMEMGEGDGENEGRGAGAAGRPVGVKRDFFGRIINEARGPTGEDSEGSRKRSGGMSGADAGTGQQHSEGKVWVAFHEGSSNATRKPITLKELLESFEKPGV